MARGGRTGRERDPDTSEPVVESSRPAPGKLTSTQRLSGQSHNSYSVSPGKRPMTMGLPDAQTAPLPDAETWSQRMGADVSSARIATGADAAGTASAIGARAFTVGKTVFFGDGAYQPSSHSGQHLIAHELAHTLQQPSATASGGPLPTSQPGDASEQEAHRAADLMMAGQPVPRMTPGPAMVHGDWWPFGKAGGVPVGPGGPITAPDQRPRPKTNAGEYLNNHGLRHANELPGHMANVTFALPSTYVTWNGGSSRTFAQEVGEHIRIRCGQSKPEDEFKRTVAPGNLWEIVNTARDADNPDHPEQADEYHKEVTLALANAYRDRVRESLERMIPRYVNEWNRKTLEDYNNRAKSGGTAGLKEHPESNKPGVAIRQSHPIDWCVLAALTGLTDATIVPNFTLYRKDFPAEARVTARSEPKPVKAFTWLHDKGAANWIRVTDPADATVEDVARELYGSDEMSYKITPAAPLFGLEPMGLKPDYYRALHANGGGTSPELRPGGGPQTLPQQVLSGPLADEAALAQAKGFAPGPADPATMRQQFDQVIQHFTLVQGALGPIGEEDGQLAAAKERVVQRKGRITGSNPGEAAAWSGLAREQLDILTRSLEGAQKAKQIHEAMKAEQSGQADALILHNKIARVYSRAASVSDMVTTARAMIDGAQRQIQTFVVDWLDEVFRYLRSAIINSRKSKRTDGAQNPALQVPQLDQREEEIRLELQKLRDQLLNNPDAVKGQIEAVHKKLREMSVEVALIRNIDACDEAFAALRGGKSTMGWIRGLAPGDHGNEKLEALQGQADEFDAEWKKILDEYRTGDKQKAIDELDKASKSQKWQSFFDRVARELRAQAELDKWMIFAAMVGIAVLSGGVGAIAEAAVGGGILGFVVGLTTEVTVFTALSYAVVEKEHTVAGFWGEWKKNLGVFAALRMVSGAWKLAGGEKGLGEAVAQYAAINGHALYEANQKKIREGKGALSLGEVLEVSLENLTFLIAVSIGGSLVQPWMSKLALRGSVGNRIAEVEGLHHKVSELAKRVESSKGKDRAAAKELLGKQGELLEKQSKLLDELAQYADNPGAARDAGITEGQLKQIQDARGRVDSARRQIAMTKLFASLEPVSSGSFLIARDGSIGRARGEFEAQMKQEASEPPAAGQGIKTVGELTVDSQTGVKSFSVEMKDGGSMRITERATDKPVEQGSKQIAAPSSTAVGGACFVAGTLVATPKGFAAIETLRAGHEVLTWDPAAAEMVTARVLGCMVRDVAGTLELSAGGEVIRCTSEHPFWVPGAGWLTASDLHPGTPLMAAGGKHLPVERMRRVDGGVTVYNMEVGGLHTYLVSDARVLVHNKSDMWTPMRQAEGLPPRAQQLVEFIDKLPDSVPDRAKMQSEAKDALKDANSLERDAREKATTPEGAEALRPRIDAMQDRIIKLEERATDAKQKVDALNTATTGLRAAEAQPGSGVDQRATPQEAGLFKKATDDATASEGGATPTKVLDRLARSLPPEAQQGLTKFRADKGEEAAHNALKGMNQGGGKNLVRHLVEYGLTPEVRAQRLKALADARTEFVRARLDAQGLLQGHKQVAVAANKIVAEMGPARDQTTLDNKVDQANVSELCGEIGEAIAGRQLAEQFKPQDGYKIISNLEIGKEVPGYATVADFSRATGITGRDLAKYREGNGKVYESLGEIDHVVVTTTPTGKLKPAMFEQVKSGAADSPTKAAGQNTQVVQQLTNLRGGQTDIHILEKIDKTTVGTDRTAEFDLTTVDTTRQQTRGLQGKDGFDKTLDLGFDSRKPDEQRSALEAVARILVKDKVATQLNTTPVPPPGGGGGP